MNTEKIWQTNLFAPIQGQFGPFVWFPGLGQWEVLTERRPIPSQFSPLLHCQAPGQTERLHGRRVLTRGFCLRVAREFYSRALPERRRSESGRAVWCGSNGSIAIHDGSTCWSANASIRMFGFQSAFLCSSSWQWISPVLINYLLHSFRIWTSDRICRIFALSAFNCKLFQFRKISILKTDHLVKRIRLRPRIGGQ